MKSLLLAWQRAVRTFFARHFAVVIARLTRFLDARPAVKRGLIVFTLFALGALPVVLLFGFDGGPVWAVALAALFLGLGAERNSMDWGDFTALPAYRNFYFWRWHALERKRFLSALTALAIGVFASLVWEHV